MFVSCLVMQVKNIILGANPISQFSDSKLLWKMDYHPSLYSP